MFMNYIFDKLTTQNNLQELITQVFSKLLCNKFACNLRDTLLQEHNLSRFSWGL